MNLATFLVVAALAGSTDRAPRETTNAHPATSSLIFASQDVGAAKRSQSERPHRIGVGASLGISNHGAGGAMRYWFGDSVGLDLQASWYRPYRATTTQGTTTPSRGNTFHVLPSILISLKKPNQTADVDVRPYVGGGLNYLSSSRPTAAPLSSLDQRTNGVGGQVFGGLEMTFRDAPNMTISAEGVYYQLPVRTVNARAIDGFNYIVAFHYYLK